MGTMFEKSVKLWKLNKSKTSNGLFTGLVYWLFTGQPKLGDIIRSIDFTSIKSYDGSPSHPITKLKDIKERCFDDSIPFEELKDGYKAFEKKICVKDFPEADKPGSLVACKTSKILNKITNSFLERNGDLFTEVSEYRLHALMSVLQAGLNSTHVTLLWSFTNGWGGLESYLRMLETEQLIQLLKALKIAFRYPRNNALDEAEYSDRVRFRLAEIFEKIGLDQYEPDVAQRAFLDLYQYYHTQIPGLTDKLANEIYFLTRNMVEQFQDENPYLDFKDVAILKHHLKTVQEIVSSKRYKTDGPIDDAAKAMIEKLMKAIVENELVSDLFDPTMEMIIEVYRHDNARAEAGLVINKIRSYLIREIGERKIPIEPLFKSCLRMVQAITAKGTLSDDSRLMAEDVIDIFIKQVEHPSSDDVKQTLLFLRCIVLSGSRDLLVTIKGILTSLKTRGVLDWKKYKSEARGILEAVGEVTVQTIRDDGDVPRTLMEYGDFVEDYLNILSKTEIKRDIQSSLVSVFFKCVEDETMTKVRIADAVADREGWDLSNEKRLRIEVLTKCDRMLKNVNLDWQNPYLIGAVGKLVHTVINSYTGDGATLTEEDNKLFVSIFLTVSEGGKSVTKQWYQLQHPDRSNVKLRIWNGALRRFVELHQESSTLSCLAPVMPNIIRWTQIAVNEKHEDMIDCMLRILTAIGRNPPLEFSCYVSELLDLLLNSDKCQDLYSLINELYRHNPDAVHQKLNDIFKALNKSTGKDETTIPWVLHSVAEHHPEVFNKRHIGTIFERTKKGNSQEQSVMLMVIKNISDKHPAMLNDSFPYLCDAAIFKEDTVPTRSVIIAAVAIENKALGQKAVDYLMKFALFSGPPISTCALSAVCTLIDAHRDCVIPYKAKLEKLEKSSKNPQVKQLIHSILQMLKGGTMETEPADTADVDTTHSAKESQQNIQIDNGQSVDIPQSMNKKKPTDNQLKNETSTVTKMNRDSYGPYRSDPDKYNQSEEKQQYNTQTKGANTESESSESAQSIQYKQKVCHVEKNTSVKKSEDESIQSSQSCILL